MQSPVIINYSTLSQKVMMSHLTLILKRKKPTNSATDFFFSFVSRVVCYACVLCQEPPETLRHLLLRSEGDCGFGWILISHSTAWSERASVLAFYHMRPCGSIQRRSKGNCVCWTGMASMLQVRWQIQPMPGSSPFSQETKCWTTWEPLLRFLLYSLTLNVIKRK